MKKTIIKLLVTLSILSLVVVACGDDKKDSSSDNKKSETSMKEKDKMSDEETAMKEKSVGEIAMADNSFTTLVDLVVATGLDSVLQGEGTYTVFAPSNDAFAKVPAATLSALQANKVALKQDLTYHVLGSVMKSSDLTDGKVLTTVEGSKLTVGVDGDMITITDDSGTTVNIVKADIEGSNGVIHVIDGVLIPKDLAL